MKGNGSSIVFEEEILDTRLDFHPHPHKATMLQEYQTEARRDTSLDLCYTIAIMHAPGVKAF